MSRVRASNSFTTKIFTIIFVILFIAAVLVLCASVIIRDKNNNTFDLGEMKSDEDYVDKIVNSYSDFEKITKKYGVSFSVKKADFNENSFLILFQDYNPCGETKPKTIQNISINESVSVTFKLHNKCGWCQRHMVMYILKVDKIASDKDIEYKYVFPSKQLDCGAIG